MRAVSVSFPGFLSVPRPESQSGMSKHVADLPSQCCSLCRSVPNCGEMDDAFPEFLDSGGVGEHAVEVLRKEDILTKRTFALLHEEHMQRLLPKLTVGQHVIINIAVAKGSSGE